MRITHIFYNINTSKKNLVLNLLFVPTQRIYIASCSACWFLDALSNIPIVKRFFLLVLISEEVGFEPTCPKANNLVDYRFQPLTHSSIFKSYYIYIFFCNTFYALFLFGGRGGSRTHATFRSLLFQSSAIGLSATHPYNFSTSYAFSHCTT